VITRPFDCMLADLESCPLFDGGMRAVFTGSKGIRAMSEVVDGTDRTENAWFVEPMTPCTFFIADRPGVPD